MGRQLVLDYRSLAAVVVAAFAFIGALQGGARSIVAVAVSLALIVGIGEPPVAAVLLRVGEKVASVLRRAVSAGAVGPITQTGPYYFAVYLALLLAVMLVARAALRETAVSRSSRLLGTLLGVLNGLLFTLMLREHLLPALGGAGAWDISIRLQPQAVAGSLLADGGFSVGTVAYVFGLLLAGAGVLRKVRGLRGPSV
jgi:hypothetical protein